MYYKIQDLTCVVCKNELKIKTFNKQDYTQKLCTDALAYKLIRCPHCNSPMREVLADSGLLILNSQNESLECAI